MQSHHPSKSEFEEYVSKKCQERCIEVVGKIFCNSTYGESSKDPLNHNRIKNNEKEILTTTFIAQYDKTSLDLSTCFARCPEVIRYNVRKIKRKT